MLDICLLLVEHTLCSNKEMHPSLALPSADCPTVESFYRNQKVFGDEVCDDDEVLGLGESGVDC
jgi:hypothetical protein